MGSHSSFLKPIPDFCLRRTGTIVPFTIVFHAQCDVVAVAKVLLATLQRREMMSAKRRRIKQEPGEIGCALSANGCVVVVGDYIAKQRHA